MLVYIDMFVVVTTSISMIFVYTICLYLYILGILVLIEFLAHKLRLYERLRNLRLRSENGPLDTNAITEDDLSDTKSIADDKSTLDEEQSSNKEVDGNPVDEPLSPKSKTSSVAVMRSSTHTCIDE